MLLGIGFSEIVIIAVVALVFIGPERMPELMRQAGRMFVHLRRMSFELRNSVDEVISETQRQMDLEKLMSMKEAKPTFSEPETSVGIKPPSSEPKKGASQPSAEA